MLTGLDPDNLHFPDPATALEDPNGLLALGGDLSPERLLAAYQRGIFPWYEEGHPILWWSPDPRMVLFPDELHISRSLRKTLQKARLRVTANQAFGEVIRQCAGKRHNARGTWITQAMQEAYNRLHALGYAHSVEVWQDGVLAGGLYGLAIGRVYFGESMFSHVDNASKIAFAHLVKHLQAWDYELIDCQVSSEHLASLGAREISRTQFLSLLPRPLANPSPCSGWQHFADSDGGQNNGGKPWL